MIGRYGYGRTCSAESCSSNSIKAYCKLSPVFLSLTISQLNILPNLEKINSRSSSAVTGLSLQTNNIFSGGLTAANGISPIISSVSAEEAAAVFRRSSSDSSSSNLASGSSVSDILTDETESGGRMGESGTGRKFTGSGYGSSTKKTSSAQSNKG